LDWSANGNFLSKPRRCSGDGTPFANLLRFSDWLYAQIGRTDTIALARLAEKLFEFITVELKVEKQLAAETLWRDWQRGAADPPEFIRSFLRPKASCARANNPPCQAAGAASGG